MNTLSIALRLRRITYEDAYIAVPITDTITCREPDGGFGIDPDALFAEGVRVGHDKRVEWRVESNLIMAHPLQKPVPDDRQQLDTFYDFPESEYDLA